MKPIIRRTRAVATVVACVVVAGLAVGACGETVASNSPAASPAPTTGPSASPAPEVTPTPAPEVTSSPTPSATPEAIVVPNIEKVKLAAEGLISKDHFYFTIYSGTVVAVEQNPDGTG